MAPRKVHILDNWVRFPDSATTLLLLEKLKTKGKIHILQINRQERDYLVSKGIRFGENGLKATTSRHSGKAYYVTESQRVIRLLEDYHKSAEIV